MGFPHIGVIRFVLGVHDVFTSVIGSSFFISAFRASFSYFFFSGSRTNNTQACLATNFFSERILSWEGSVCIGSSNNSVESKSKRMSLCISYKLKPALTIPS